MADMDYRATPHGTFAVQPLGVILHGSRSGRSQSTMAEFRGTAAWAVSNPERLSWHATIGPNVYATHLTATEIGWHAGEHNPTYLGVEFAQPTAEDAISDAQVAAFAAWYRARVLPVWPGLTPDRVLLPAHAEMPQGIAAGKSDVFPRGDARNDELRARLRAALGAPAAPATGGQMDASDTDAALEREYQRERGSLGAKRAKARLTRGYYDGAVLLADRGVVGPSQELTEIIRKGLLDDAVTLFEANGWLTRY